MKKILKYSIIIGILVISIDKLLGLFLSNLYEKNYCLNAGGHLNSYLKHSLKDTIVIGSSRVSTMINPDILGSDIINVSAQSKHLYYHIGVVDLMNQYNKMPRKLVIFNIEVEDIFLINNKRLVEDVFYLKYYYNSNNYIKSVIDQKSAFEKYKFLFSTYRFNGENFTIFTNPFQNICFPLEKGFVPLTISQNDNIKLKAGIAEMKQIKLKEINPEFFIKMKYLFKLCKINNVKIIVLYGPNYFMPKSFTKASYLIARFCKKNKVDYLDFSKKYFAEFHKIDLWSDHIHLNNIGAEKYSLLLKKELSDLPKKTYN